MKLSKSTVLFILRYQIILLIALILIPTISISALGQSAKTSLIYGSSTTTTSADYPGHIKIAEIGASEIGEITVTSPGGTVACTQGLYQKESHVAGSTDSGLYEAISGLSAWKGIKQPNTLRVLHVLAMLDVPICVRESTGINSISELKGKKVFLGWPGTTTYAMYELIFDALELEIEPFVADLSDAVDAYKDNRIDVFVKSVDGNTIDKTHMDINNTSPIKFISYTDEEVKKVRDKYPWITFQKYPAGYFIQFPELGELWMYSTAKIAICRDDFPEDWAYKWVKSNVERRDEVIQVWKSAGFVDILDTPKIIGKIPDLYLHPGALKYYQEIGAEIPDNVIPPEMKNI